jgi:hypothetical protein
MLSSQLLEVGNGLGRVAASVAVHPKHPVVEAGFDEGRVIVCALSRQEKGRALALAGLGPGHRSGLVARWHPPGRRYRDGRHLAFRPL